MEANILDLRQQRCPLALLLAKRHANQLQVGEQCCILIREPSSFRDIQAFLQKHAFQLLLEDAEEHFRIHVQRLREIS